jgi:hypothetical protein
MLKYSNYFNTVAPVYLSTGWPYHVQGDPEEKVSNVESDSIGHCKKKSSYEHVSNCDLLLRQS